MSLSLLPRLPKTKPYLLETRFEDGFEILVDSGGFNAAKREGFDHEEHVRRYTEWVAQNIDRITLVTEYDVTTLGLDWIEFWRRTFWDKLPPEKFIPVWHEEHGMDELHRLCDRYQRVGITKTTGVNIEALLRNIQAQTGVKLHGAGITATNTLARVPFSSVSSTSWLSPTRNGEAHIWAGNKLNWFPRVAADSKRALYKTDVERAGFDPDLYEVGENNTVNRYSAWAWRQYEKQLLNRPVISGTGEISGTDEPVDHSADVFDIATGEVVHPRPERTAKALAVPRDRVLVPGLSMRSVEVANPQVGSPNTVDVPSLQAGITRVCSNCSLQHSCPEYRPGSEFAFSVPVQIRTVEQLRGWASMLVEMQMQRVMMLRMGEEMQGGAPDAALSAEMDRLSRLQLQFKELFEEGFSLNLQVKGSGQSSVGVISRLFGAEAGDVSYQANQAIDPRLADGVVAEILDIEPE